MERARSRTFEVVHTVAIGAGGDIWIALPDECGPMNASLINVINLGVTALACLGDAATGNVRRSGIMGAVTVRAHCCLQVATGE
jgi:hypothetical protein